MKITLYIPDSKLPDLAKRVRERFEMADDASVGAHDLVNKAFLIGLLDDDGLTGWEVSVEEDREYTDDDLRMIQKDAARMKPRPLGRLQTQGNYMNWETWPTKTGYYWIRFRNDRRSRFNYSTVLYSAHNPEEVKEIDWGWKRIALIPNAMFIGPLVPPESPDYRWK